MPVFRVLTGGGGSPGQREDQGGDQDKFTEMKNLMSRRGGSTEIRAMMLTVERWELVKKLDSRLSFVSELLQVYLLASDYKKLGISVPDPNIFKREALDYAKKYGDVKMNEYTRGIQQLL